MRWLRWLGGLAALLGLAVLAWVWPLGLESKRLGDFTFDVPRSADVRSPEETRRPLRGFCVTLLESEPHWVASVPTTTVDGLEARVLRGRTMAPVVGPSSSWSWSRDVRDNSLGVWFPERGEGLYVYWRSYGAVDTWLRDTRLARAAEALLASLRIGS